MFGVLLARLYFFRSSSLIVSFFFQPTTTQRCWFFWFHSSLLISLRDFLAFSCHWFTVLCLSPTESWFGHCEMNFSWLDRCFLSWYQYLMLEVSPVVAFSCCFRSAILILLFLLLLFIDWINLQKENNRRRRHRSPDCFRIQFWYLLHLLVAAEPFLFMPLSYIGLNYFYPWSPLLSTSIGLLCIDAAIAKPSFNYIIWSCSG